MVATTSDGDSDIPIGATVRTVDGQRLGYVVDGDAYEVGVGDGFLFRLSYVVRQCDVDRYEDGMLVLKLASDQVAEDGDG